MAVLSNARHETFAQALASGKSASEAMTAAGYKPDRGNGSRLTAIDSIQQRVAELRAKAAEKAGVDQAWVMAKLVENAKSDNVAGSNRALELIGKELGMFVERSENVNRNYDISDEPQSEDDWAEQHARPN